MLLPLIILQMTFVISLFITEIYGFVYHLPIIRISQKRIRSQHKTQNLGAWRINSKTQLSLSATSKTGGRSIANVEQYNDYVLGESLKSTNQPNRPVLVFWTAPWCGPCRLSIPVVKDVMKQFANKIDVVEICTDNLPDLAAEAGVVSIPTIHICYKGKQLDTIIGCVAKTVLASAVEKALEDITLKHGGSLNVDIINGNNES